MMLRPVSHTFLNLLPNHVHKHRNEQMHHRPDVQPPLMTHRHQDKSFQNL